MIESQAKFWTNAPYPWHAIFVGDICRPSERNKCEESEGCLRNGNADGLWDDEVKAKEDFEDCACWEAAFERKE